MKKILLVTTGLSMGGAERQVCSLADSFQALGYIVKILSLNGDVIASPNDKEIEIFSIRMKKDPLGLLKGYLTARKIIKEFNPDVIHSHMVHANIFCRLLRLSLPINRLISTAHSTNEGGKLRQLGYRLTDSLADISTNVSQEAVDAFIENGSVPSKDRMILVENGIDTDKFKYNISSRNKIRTHLKIDDDVKLFLSVGRLTLAKDYQNLLYAFSQLLKSTSSNLILVIIGTGELNKTLLDLTSELQLEKNVRFLGLQNNIEQWLSACDVYVMSSEWEGLPLTLVEAMACEKFIVATDCGGNKKLVEDYGYIVPIKDSTALSNAMLQSLSLSDVEKKNIGALARSKIVQQYSLTSIAKQWLSLYKK